MSSVIYLDNAATTRVSPEVVSRMLPYFSDHYGNPSSPHALGRAALDALESARSLVAQRFGVPLQSVIFTSGGTESNNLAILGVARKRKSGHIVTSRIEHPSVLEVCRQLEHEGFSVTYLAVSSEGLVSLDDVSRAVRDDTILVSIQHANNEIGTLQPIADIARVCKRLGVPFHTDVVQSFCREPIVLGDGQWMISLSAHKINGPKGVGALVCNGVLPDAIVFGGGQEGVRSGTENVAGIVGFAAAVELYPKDASEKMRFLRDRLIAELLRIPDARLNGSSFHRLSSNVHVSFRLIDSTTLIEHLSQEGICASAGSACHSARLQASHVLDAIGLSPEWSHGALRLSLSPETTEVEVDGAAESVRRIVSDLREAYGSRHHRAV